MMKSGAPTVAGTLALTESPPRCELCGSNSNVMEEPRGGAGSRGAATLGGRSSNKQYQYLRINLTKISSLAGMPGSGSEPDDLDAAAAPVGGGGGGGFRIDVCTNTTKFFCCDYYLLFHYTLSLITHTF